VELREYVRACRRRWVWIFVPVLLAAGIAASLTLTAAPAYRSSMVLYVTTGTSDPDAKASRLNSYIALLTGPRVAQSVVAKLGLPISTDQVQKSLTAQVQDGTDLLVVSATDADARRSESLVTTATTVLVGLAEQLDPPTTSTDGSPAPSVSIAQDPVTTRQPTNLVRNVGFSAVLGLLIGAVAIAGREATRKTVTEEDDLRRLGLGAVGMISIGSRYGRNGHPDEELAEAFRRLRSLLPEPAGLRRGNARGASLLLTGPNPKEGTTAVALGLAIAMAETGARVALVDANLRSPGVGRYLALDDGPGLAEVLIGAASLPEALQDSLDGRLTVLPSGEHPADPGGALASPRLSSTVRNLTQRFDIVLVDAPPLLGAADAAVLSKVSDGALLVVRANHTRTADVQRSTDLLDRVGARVTGAVLNALPRKLPTGAAWHHARQMTGPSGHTQLVGELFGEPDPAGDQYADDQLAENQLADDQLAEDQLAEDELAAGAARDDSPVPLGTVRGRARVVVASTVGPPAEPDDKPPAREQQKSDERAPGE
jgi:capsular exopolysaccharide synthesis family protein